MQLSVAARNNLLEAIELTYNGQTLSAGTGAGGNVTGTAAQPKFRIHTGTMPANCAAARTGTTLVDITCPADLMSAAASGDKALNGTWQAAAAAAGLGGYYSILDNAGTTCHEQGLVSQPHAVSTAYLLNQQVHNAGNVYRCTTAGTSGASSPPTGTGSGIADGTAVWAYVGPLDVALDNSNIGSGQTVTITSKTLTAPNP
jgi:hypothetical protein